MKTIHPFLAAKLLLAAISRTGLVSKSSICRYVGITWPCLRNWNTDAEDSKASESASSAGFGRPMPPSSVRHAVISALDLLARAAVSPSAAAEVIWEIDPPSKSGTPDFSALLDPVLGNKLLIDGVNSVYSEARETLHCIDLDSVCAFGSHVLVVRMNDSCLASLAIESAPAPSANGGPA